MRIGVRELRRRPGRFGVVGGALVLLTVLLVLLGALLDGLVLGGSGAFRAQRGDVIAYAAGSRESLNRSRVEADVRALVEQVDGVAGVGGFGVAQVGARVPGEDELADAVVVGYELGSATLPAPPGPGTAHADRRLAQGGVEVGDVLEVGPARVPIEVVGFVDDTSYQQQGSLWVEPGTWREVLSSSRPDEVLDDDTFQALVVVADDGVDAAELAERVDAATDGATSSLTRSEAIDSLPGSAEQTSVFNLLIGVTLLAAGLVSALFFALLVIERIALLATLKALGAGSGTLVASVVVQAVVVATAAVVVGGLLAVALGAIVPPAVPVRIEPSRALSSAALVVGAAALGGALSVRRISRIDPATAIGGGT